MKLSITHRLLLLTLFLLIIVSYVWGIWAVFTSKYNGGNDFFSRYIAWQAFIIEGRNPYSDDVTHDIQIAINGRVALPGEDENALIYPWYAVLLQWPFIFLPWSIARAVYIVLCQVFILIGLLLTARLLRWKPPPALLVGTVVWAILFYPEARGIILGQIVITQYILIVIALWLLSHRYDGWAAMCLALSTVRPPAVVLVVPFVLFYMLSRKRWRFIGTFALSMLILVFTGFIFLPNWFNDWLYRVSRYPSYTVDLSPIWLFKHPAPTMGTILEILFIILFFGLLMVAWWIAMRRKDDAAFFWALSATFVVSGLIVPRSSTTNFIFLLIPFSMIFAKIMRTWSRVGVWIIVGIEIVSLVGYWWLFIVTVQGIQEQSIIFVPLLVMFILVLTLGYRWLVGDRRENGIVE